MTAEPDLNSRVDVIEDHLVENYQARRLVGFPPLYAASTVAIVVLLWFSPYNQPQPGDDDKSAVFEPSMHMVVTILIAITLLSAMVTALLRPDRDNLAAPVITAALGALSAILLLAKFGATGNPDLSGTGRAAVCVLFAATFTGVGHAVTIHRLRQPEPTPPPTSPDRQQPPS